MFAFAVKELAVERIVVVDAGGVADLVSVAHAWTLDDAHCFDPNEEGKLRRLAKMIGVDKFKQCVAALSECAVDRRTSGCVPGLRAQILPAPLTVAVK